MAKRIMTVGCEIPGGFGEHVSINSQASLLDADIVLFHPTMGTFFWDHHSTYQGKPSLPEDSSFRVQKAVEHWRRELLDFLRAGRTVFVVLTDLREVYVDTGERQYSGTGRNRQTTTVVRPLSNFDLLPLSTKIVGSRGTSMVLTPGENILREYWRQFGGDSNYRVYIERSDAIRPLVVTGQGDRVVGGFLRTKSGGTLVALPWIDFEGDEDFTEEYEDDEGDTRYKWTHKALEWGKRYLESLVALDYAIVSQDQATPIPQWASGSIYLTSKEAELSQRLLSIQREIADLERTREDTMAQLTDAGWLRALLFEQGHPLEDAVLQAMHQMGFEASRYRDPISEFDVVLVCPEGRCIGEVEGRDSKAIDISKMRQLAMNIQEDFSREEVQEVAKGVLFGNAYRLTAPPDRPDTHFTEKCATAARSSGTALVRTCDLFEVAKALVDNPDETFAAACRQAIFNASGQEVRFPVHPAGIEREQNENIFKRTALERSSAVSQ